MNHPNRPAALAGSFLALLTVSFAGTGCTRPDTAADRPIDAAPTITITSDPQPAMPGVEGSGEQRNASEQPRTAASNTAGAKSEKQAAKAGSGIDFTRDPQAAIKTAAANDKIVMLDVYTDWCTWCKKLDSDVFAQPAVAEAVGKDFVALKVNPEKGPAEKAFVDQYKVRGFPTILFLNGKGEEVHRIVGYVEEADFLRELDAAKEKAAQA